MTRINGHEADGSEVSDLGQRSGDSRNSTVLLELGEGLAISFHQRPVVVNCKVGSEAEGSKACLALRSLQEILRMCDAENMHRTMLHVTSSRPRLAVDCHIHSPPLRLSSR
jgi:hypothetical protein